MKNVSFQGNEQRACENVLAKVDVVLQHATARDGTICDNVHQQDINNTLHTYCTYTVLFKTIFFPYHNNLMQYSMEEQETELLCVEATQPGGPDFSIHIRYLTRHRFCLLIPPLVTAFNCAFVPKKSWQSANTRNNKANTKSMRKMIK